MSGFARVIGGLVMVAAALVVVVVLVRLWPRSAADAGPIYVVLFDRAAGLRPTTAVTFDGVAVGEVESVEPFLSASFTEEWRQEVLACKGQDLLARPDPEAMIVAKVDVRSHPIIVNRSTQATVGAAPLTGRATLDLTTPDPGDQPWTWRQDLLFVPPKRTEPLVEMVRGWQGVTTKVATMNDEVRNWWKPAGRPARRESLEALAEVIRSHAGLVERVERAVSPGGEAARAIDRWSGRFERMESSLSDPAWARKVEEFLGRLPRPAPDRVRAWTEWCREAEGDARRFREVRLRALQADLQRLRGQVSGTLSELDRRLGPLGDSLEGVVEDGLLSGGREAVSGPVPGERGGD